MKTRELIAELEKLPADADVVIDDADTDWPLNIVQVGLSDKGYVFVQGLYSDVHD